MRRREGCNGPIRRSKPHTTGLCPFDGEFTAEPWHWGTAIAGSAEHPSPRLRTGRSVVRGKDYE